MSSTKGESVQPRAQYEKYLGELVQLVEEAEALRLTLFQTLTPAIQKLERHLRKHPGKPTSHYWQQYKDHWQAFQLFRERVAHTCKQLQQEHLLPTPFDSNPSDPQLEAWIDEIEEILQAYRLRKQQQHDLMTVIELLDSVERLRAIRIPKPLGEAGEPIFTALSQTSCIVKETGNSIALTLSEVGVDKIELHLGIYPPPETTRIVGQDNTQTETLSISAVTLNGYLWNGKLLRKADVIVSASQESI